MRRGSWGSLGARIRIVRAEEEVSMGKVVGEPLVESWGWTRW